jgi:aspergillopepsin I
VVLTWPQESGRKYSEADVFSGDNSYAYGNVWKDVVSVGSLVIDNMTVESAVEISPGMFSQNKMSGILGLAYTLTSRVTPPQPNLVNNIAPLMSQNVFTADLKWHAEGSYNFGSIDSSQYQGDIHYTDLIDDAEFWEFVFTGFNTAPSLDWYISEWKGIADTGTTLLLLPDSIIITYYSNVATADNSTTGDGMWSFPCDTQLPDFNLGFANGWHATIPGKYINYTVTDINDRCYGGLQSNQGESFSILGDIFLKAVFAVFDVSGKRVGFANKDLD